MKTLTILVDMDDTIVELLPVWVKHLNLAHNFNILPDEITDWKIGRFFPSISQEQVFFPLYNDDFWKEVKPKLGAVEYLRQLIDDGHTIYIVTSSFCDTLSQKMKYAIYPHFPYLSWDNIIVTSNKQMIRGDILVDDGVHNHDGGAHFGILMDTPHNRYFDNEAQGIIRVQAWPEVYYIINNIAGQWKTSRTYIMEGNGMVKREISEAITETAEDCCSGDYFLGSNECFSSSFDDFTLSYMHSKTSSFWQ